MKTITIDSMLVVDDTGMPVPPTIRQLLDRDIRTLYTRDKVKIKNNILLNVLLFINLEILNLLLVNLDLVKEKL